MMSAVRAVPLLVAFYLLISAATAHAEGAWVLWVEDEHMSQPQKDGTWGAQSRTWDVISASLNDAECRRKLREVIERVTHPEFPQKDATLFYKATGDTVSILYYPKDSKPTDTMTRAQTLNYVCLPDTVDPRGLKGR